MTVIGREELLGKKTLEIFFATRAAGRRKANQQRTGCAGSMKRNTQEIGRAEWALTVERPVVNEGSWTGTLGCQKSRSGNERGALLHERFRRATDLRTCVFMDNLKMTIERGRAGTAIRLRSCYSITTCKV